MARWAFIAVYTGSGAAGLIYQVIWTRLLSTYLGHTVAAAGTVLAAFMGGLAAGSLAAGYVTRRGLSARQALIAYAAAEVVIALAALTLPFALEATAPLLARAYGARPGAVFGLARVGASLLLVFLPAVAMGATYPLAVRATADRGTRAADAARLYTFNTAGAAIGAVLAGFLLVPALGLFRTTLGGVMLNVLAAGVAWRLAMAGVTTAADAPGSPVPPSPPASTRATRRRGAVSSPSGAPRLAAAIAGLSGLAALVFEVAFTRALAVVLGPTSYAFAAMLAAFITGLAIGAALATRYTRTARAPGLAVAWLLTTGAAAAAAAAWFTGTRLPMLIASIVADASLGGTSILTYAAMYAAAVLLPLSTALGAVFPLCLSLASDEGALGDGQVAWLYGVNTIGAIAGSLGAAFVLVPVLGVRQTLHLGAALALAGALLATLATPRSLRWAALVAVPAVAALPVLLPPWDVNLLSAGGYKYAADVRDLRLDVGVGLRAGRLEFYREGAAGAVSVRRLAGTLALAIDGKVDASNGPDMMTQKLLAHLPLLLHEDPDEVCIIGLGSGVTLGAALQHPVARADVVEISPEVVDASAFFARENRQALDDPRAHLIVGDGRSHLRYTSRQYDVIISEPSNPWMSGAAALFTREFFEEVRARLAPGGIVCQWAHTYDLTDRELRSIAGTFTSVFPHATMWLVGRGDVLFVATREAPGPDLAGVAERWSRPHVAGDLADAGVFDPFSLLSLFVAEGAALRQYGAHASVETDDRPSLEFSGPVGIYDRQGEEAHTASLQQLAASEPPPAVRIARAGAGAAEWRNRGRLLARVRDYAAAYDDFARAIARDPGDALALAGAIDAAGASGRTDEARRLLESSVAAHPLNPDVRMALARLLAALGRFDEAVAQAEVALQMSPDDARHLETLASIVADAGDRARLRPLVARMRQSGPGRDETWYYAALEQFLDGNAEAAVTLAHRAVQLNPEHATAWSLIGAAHASRGRRTEAREAFQRSLSADPREPATYANLGRLAVETGDRDAALGYFNEALSLDPAEPTAREGLTQLAPTRPSR